MLLTPTDSLSEERLVSVLDKIRARVRNTELIDLRKQVDDQRIEIAEIHRILLDINHHVSGTAAVVDALNHDVRSGADVAMPLYVGYVERLRVDAETAISATQVIERQLARLELKAQD
jgi:hypothetical protein